MEKEINEVAVINYRAVGDLMKANIEIKDRTYRFKKYAQSFLGTDAVKWLIANKYAENEEMAIVFGNKMIEAGVFWHVLRDHKLKNLKLFYRFLEDEKNRGRKVEENGIKASWMAAVEKLGVKLIDHENILGSGYDELTDYHLKNNHISELLLDPLNAELMDNVRPIKWEDPTPEDKYNFVVIGAGAGGLVSALGWAGLGGKSWIIEKNLFGGDCLNTGWVPSKSLISVAKQVHTIKSSSIPGVEVGEVKIDFAKIMENLREKRTTISYHDSAERFIKIYGVDVFLGEAKFTSKNTVIVNDKTLKFSKAIIATGGRPNIPSIPGIEKLKIYSSENIFNITNLPKKMIIIGGGPIAIELGQSFSRLGSEVHTMIRGNRILHKEDKEASQIIEEVFQDENISIHKGCTYISVTPEGSSPYQGKLTYTETGSESEATMDFDWILAWAGRLPNVERIGLEEAGVKYDLDTGVIINDEMQTSNSKIFAVGDCCTKQQFTHMADEMARAVIRNALFFGSVKLSGLVIPRWTYSDPEVAAVGLTKHELENSKKEFDEYRVNMSEIDRAIWDSYTIGFAAVYTQKGKDTILGATIVGNRAGELICEVVVAMKNDIGLGEIAKSVHPYPTYGEILKKWGDLYNGTKLTGNSKIILRKILEMRR